MLQREDYGVRAACEKERQLSTTIVIAAAGLLALSISLLTQHESQNVHEPVPATTVDLNN